ncbi:MAG: transposase, partial [Candidatus Muproteobacteria bacterium RIFCSPHIGHO2_02_FULL_60_13]
MARKPRFSLPGVPQHVIQRGNNREPCFFAEDDYHRYLGDLREALDRNDCRLHALVLMTNHVHLLLTPMSEHGVSHLMQDLGRKYVRYINHTYRRSGTLWEGRYKSSLIDSEAYLLTCMRYIELNPLRASMVAHPGEYRWSSYAANANGRDNPLLSLHPVYRQLGTDPAARQHAYRELFRQHMDHTIVHDIREALNQELVLGREDFKIRIEQMTQRQTRPGRLGRPQTTDAEEAVSDYYVL